MYHVFLDHSPITHLVARAVVQHEGLDPERVVFATDSRFHPPDSDFPVVPWLDLDSLPRPPRPFRALRPRQQVRAADAWVASVTKREPFHFYTPLTHDREQLLLIGHPLCRGFSFIEEGLASYQTRERIDSMIPPKAFSRAKQLLSGGRLRRRAFFLPGQTRAYGVSEASFPGMTGRVVLAEIFRRDRSPEFERVDTILATCGLSTRGEVAYESVRAGLSAALDELWARGVRRIHFKPHRVALGGPEVADLRGLLAERGFSFEQLPDDLCLEEIAFSAPHVRFVINLSSCGIYAAAAGCEVLSYARLVARAEPGFAHTIDMQPRAFHQGVEFL